MTKQTIITIIIIALIFFGIGFALASYYKSGDNTYQAGWDAAKQRLAETGYVPTMNDMEITFVDGIVQEVRDNKIYLKIQSLTPLANSELDNRIIETDENTKIYELVEKDQEQYQIELDEFTQKMQEEMDNPEIITEPIMPPEPFIKQEINFNEIQVNQQIMVMAQEDIKDIKQFKAIEIIMQFMPIGEEVESIDELPVQETDMPVAPAPTDELPLEEMN